MTRIGILLLLLALPASRPGAAQDGGLAFLRIGPDATGLALGDAGAAGQEGLFAAYWNPAALASGTGTTVGLSHHRWISDVRTYAAGARFDVGSTGGLGVFVTATGSGDIEARQTPGEPDGVFDAQFVSVAAAYARTFGRLRIGVAAKFLSERIFDVSANGVAYDIGAQTSFFDEALQLGVSLQHFGSMQALTVRETKLPRTIRGGMVVHPFRVLAFDDGATLVDSYLILEVSHNLVDESSRIHAGVSAAVLETVHVRVGYLSNDTLRDFTAGVGLLSGPFRIDYVLIPFEAGFGGPGHVFTLAYGLGS